MTDIFQCAGWNPGSDNNLQKIPGELRYAIDAELKGVGLVRYGTGFMPQGKVLLRHLRQQQYLNN